MPHRRPRSLPPRCSGLQHLSSRTSRSGRSRRLAAATGVAVGVALVLTLTACDTNDGRELADPKYGLPVTAAPTTVPADTAPFPTALTEVPSTGPAPVLGLTLIAPWAEGGEIPVRNTCDGDDLAPALTWLDVPAGTVELAVAMTDIDAVGFVHWLMYAIPGDREGLVEGETPAGARYAVNSFGDAAYGGPCPPEGETHRYVLTVYALGQAVGAADRSPADDVIASVEAASIASSSVTGVYARSG